MNDRAIVKMLIKEKGTSQTKLAESAGFKSQSNITGLLNNNLKGMRTDNLYRLLSAMGCSLIVRDNETGREYVITEDKNSTD